MPKKNKNKICINLRQQNTNNIIAVQVNPKSKWFRNHLTRSIKRKFKIGANVYIYFRTKLSEISNGDIVQFGIGRHVNIKFKISNTDNIVTVFASKQTKIYQLNELISKRSKYQFKHNGITLCMTYCIKDYDIKNGDIIICDKQKEKELDSITINKITNKWFENKSNVNINICIKRYLLMPNISDLYGISIHIICDTKKCINKLNELQGYKPKYVGFDCEWQRGKNKPSLIQIASKEMVLLIRIHLLRKIPVVLHRFCMDENIKKCGVAIKNDGKKLKKTYNIILNGCIDLKKYGNNRRKSLEKLCEDFVGQRMIFKKMVNHWRWKSKYLDHIQISYASDDAVAGYLVYQRVLQQTKPEIQNNNYQQPHQPPHRVKASDHRYHQHERKQDKSQKSQKSNVKMQNKRNNGEVIKVENNNNNEIKDEQIEAGLVGIGVILLSYYYEDPEEIDLADLIIRFVEVAIPASVAILLGYDVFNSSLLNGERNRMLYCTSIIFIIFGLMGSIFYAYVANWKPDELSLYEHPYKDELECIAAGYFILTIFSVIRILIFEGKIEIHNPTSQVIAKLAVSLLLIIGGFMCAVGYWAFADAAWGDSIADYDDQIKCWYIELSLFILGISIVKALDMGLVQHLKACQAVQLYTNQ